MDKLDSAINGLEWILDDDRFGFGVNWSEDDKPEDEEEQAGYIIQQVINMLKEQQPKDVKNVRYVADLFIGECPSCGEYLNNEVYPHSCGFCGQPILWRVGDEE